MAKKPLLGVYGLVQGWDNLSFRGQHFTIPHGEHRNCAEQYIDLHTNLWKLTRKENFTQHLSQANEKRQTSIHGPDRER